MSDTETFTFDEVADIEKLILDSDPGTLRAGYNIAHRRGISLLRYLADDRKAEQAKPDQAQGLRDQAEAYDVNKPTNITELADLFPDD